MDSSDFGSILGGPGRFKKWHKTEKIANTSVSVRVACSMVARGKFGEGFSEGFGRVLGAFGRHKFLIRAIKGKSRSTSHWKGGWMVRRGPKRLAFRCVNLISGSCCFLLFFESVFFRFFFDVGSILGGLGPKTLDLGPSSLFEVFRVEMSDFRPKGSILRVLGLKTLFLGWLFLTFLGLFGLFWTFLDVFGTPSKP